MSEKEFKIETTELEFKYDSKDIPLSRFVSFANSNNPVSQKEAASWDLYYSGSGLPFEFFRFRKGTRPELTTKIKTEEKNNNRRVEVDLPLNPEIADSIVLDFVSQFGFKENFRVWKYCHIFYYEKTDIVYYVMYNEEMNEVGRRIEIEARKDYPFKSEEEAVAEVKAMEQKMAKIGISPQMRMKKSNWEQLRRDV